MNLVKDDFWNLAPHYNALVCTINKQRKSNGELVMGAGIAKDFKERYHWLAYEWGGMLKGNVIINPTDYRQYLVGVVTKIHWKDDSTVQLVKDAISNINILANMFEWEKVLLTQFGCGNGNLKWDNVKHLFEKLDDRFTVVYK